MKPALILMAFIFLPLPAVSATIYVPDNYPTIQEAVNAALNGDTVIVRSGTYLENILIDGKTVTLKSEQGPEATVIDGQRANSVVRLVRSDSTLEGFTLTNGRGYYLTFSSGGGIYCDSSSPTITGNIITDNLAFYGGGIYTMYGSPTIENNVISDNISDSGPGCGVGICCVSSTTLIENNIISNNSTATGDGGGIYSFFASTTIKGNAVSGNSAETGGGIQITYDIGPATIAGNTVTGNSAIKGGGLHLFLTSPAISNNTFSDNSAKHGGGLYLDSSSSIVSGNIVSRNMPTPPGGSSGGGIYSEGSDLAVVNNTITLNAAETGGGIHLDDSASPIMANTIFWDNNASTGREISLVGTTNASISHSDVEGGLTQVHIGPNASLAWGTGMIDADPLFAEPSSDDFHLQYPSPCRNNGDNSASGIPAEDIEGDPRIADGIIDMGADEFHLHLYYTGDIVPGASIKVKIVGMPGTSPVRLILGSGVQDPPQPTMYGDLYLLPPYQQFGLADIPSSGVFAVSGTVPGSWQSGEEYPFQALAGSDLTNLMLMKVE